jgi:hypothetical protein
MLGHILIRLGEVSAGLRHLEQALKWSELLGNQALSDAIQISILTYRAQYGLQPQTILRSLKTAVKRLSPQDTYSKSNLLLELARQQLLRGDLPNAFSSLDTAAEIIYSSQNRRQEVTLNHRYAYLYSMSGEPSRALNFIRSAKKSLNPAVDRALEIEVSGLESKLFFALGRLEQHQSIHAQMQKQFPFDGSAIPRRILNRESSSTEHPYRRGSDPLGDLKDLMAQNPASAIEHILKSGYWSFLYDVLPVSRNQETLYFELVPGSVTLFDHGLVHHTEGLTPLLKSFAIQVAQGDGSKRRLIEKIWKYTYHPLRHDSVVYSTATAFRKLLGEKATWLETTEQGYRLRDGVSVRFQSLPQASPQTLSQTIPRADSSHDARLSLRQLKILNYLKDNESLDARTLKQLYKVSEITATRDLARLTTLRLVIRVGQGRATRYLLPEKT